MRRLLKGNRKEWASRPQLTGMEQTVYTQRFLRGTVKKNRRLKVAETRRLSAVVLRKAVCISDVINKASVCGKNM